jgi:hypothetical protein
MRNMGDRSQLAMFVVLSIAIIAFLVWDAATCLEYGPPQISWVTTACGDGCWQTHPQETRQCIRRR